jgi:hypothetical protein
MLRPLKCAEALSCHLNRTERAFTVERAATKNGKATNMDIHFDDLVVAAARDAGACLSHPKNALSSKHFTVAEWVIGDVMMYTGTQPMPARADSFKVRATCS